MAIHIIKPEKNGKEVSYYIDDRIKKNFDTKLIPSLHKKDKDGVIVIDGGEGCLAKGTLIRTNEGTKRVEELANDVPFFLDSLNLNTRKDEINKAICFKTGDKEIFEIETEDGRIIRATKDHTFFILRDGDILELPLAELNEGDKLICK